MQGGEPGGNPQNMPLARCTPQLVLSPLFFALLVMSSPICGSGAPVEGSDVEDDASIELGPAPTPTVQEKILLLTGRHFPLHFSCECVGLGTGACFFHHNFARILVWKRSIAPSSFVTHP